MSDFRLTPKNLCMADAMPFQQHHEARIAGRDLNDVLTPQLLLNVRSNLQVGDEIVICGYQDQSWQRLTQVARLRILSNTKDAVDFVIDGEIKGIPIPEDAPEPKKTGPKLEVVKQFGGGFNVMDAEKDAVLESFKTKKEAENFAAAYGG